MKLDAKIEYLTVPAVITGNHAELLATNGRRLCATAVLTSRIGELEPDVHQTVMWRAWCRGLSRWKGQIRQTRELLDDDWKRKTMNWATRSTRRIEEQPPYKGRRPRIYPCCYSDWEEAISRLIHQIRSTRTYQNLCGWGRWATFAVNNARKRKGAHA